MRGRTLALWFRLADPDEARRHVPRLLAMDDDPVVRARFWDMSHDAAGPADDPSRPEAWRSFREAVVAFPVRHGDIAGDYPAYMYADDFVYTAFGRELMGWPVRDGDITVDEEPRAGLVAGTRVAARLVRDGHEVMRADVTLHDQATREHDPPPPVWLAVKVVGHVDRPGAAISQLVATGPERVTRRDVWGATGSLSFGEGVGDELHYLTPREVVNAQYWANVELSVGWGRVLAELGEAVWTGA
jgi:acetoacetate decarboxylase